MESATQNDKKTHAANGNTSKKARGATGGTVSWSLEKMSATELCAVEKMASLMCSRYDNILREYNGMMNTRREEYKKLSEYNRIHEAVIEMIGKRLRECVG